MADTQNIIFRNSLNGYNKSDVNNYLIKINGEFSQREEAAKERAEKAETALRASEEHSNELALQIESLKAELDQKKSEISAMIEEKNNASNAENELIYELRERAETAEESLREQESVIASQFAQIEKLQEGLNSATEDGARIKAENEEELAELKRKAQLYEKTSANIGDTILSANKTAEEIIASAKEEARLLRESAEREASEKIEMVSFNIRRAEDSIWSKMKEASEESIAEITDSSEFARKIMEKALVEINRRNEEARHRIKINRETVSKRVKIDMDSIGKHDTTAEISGHAKAQSEKTEKTERKEKSRTYSFFGGEAFRKSKK